MFNNIYKGKRVLITGHSGLKGSWLTQWLLKLGADVYGLSHSQYTHFNLLGLQDKLQDKSFGKDIRESQWSYYALEKSQPDIVFHLASQPIVSESFSDPRYTYETNVNGIINLCEAMRKYPPKVFICITTDKVYKDKQWDYAYREIDEKGGFDPYACSKACVELIVDSYRRSFFEELGILTATARAGNVLGGGDFGQDRIIPDVMRAYENKKQFRLRNPHHIRPWSYVLDILNGYLMLGEKLLKGKPEYQGVWNFGPDIESSITTQLLINKCIEYWKELKSTCHYGTKNDFTPKLEFHETKILRLDSTKARTRLGWKPKYNIDQTIEKTIDWYRCFYDMQDIITDLQIEEYEEV